MSSLFFAGPLSDASNSQRVLAGVAAGHADMDFVALTQRQGRCRDSRLE